MEGDGAIIINDTSDDVDLPAKLLTEALNHVDRCLRVVIITDRFVHDHDVFIEDTLVDTSVTFTGGDLENGAS